ncbi:MAG: hypothetical protein IT459_13425 [Planctomycetes bacterium]|nr:hypothetical protein [Planctomycetota bacterium]
MNLLAHVRGEIPWMWAQRSDTRVVSPDDNWWLDRNSRLFPRLVRARMKATGIANYLRPAVKRSLRLETRLGVLLDRLISDWGRSFRHDPVDAREAKLLTGLLKETKAVERLLVNALCSIDAASVTGAGGLEAPPVVAARKGTRASASPDNSQSANVFKREGLIWRVEFGGRSLHLPDQKGLRHIHTLIANQGRHVGVGELLAAVQHSTTPDTETAADEVAAADELHDDVSDGGPIVDDEAVDRCRIHLATLSEARKDATAAGDDERVVQIDSETAEIATYLSGARGLRGRRRRMPSAGARERCRVASAIRRALVALETNHPEFWRHLSESLVQPSSASPSYSPKSPVTWMLG